MTTTHRSNPRVRSLARELTLCLPRALKVNRGKMSFEEVLERARALGAKRVVVVGRGLKGNPGRLEILSTSLPLPRAHLLLLKLKGVKLAREQGVRPKPPLNLVVVTTPVEEVVNFAHEVAIALDLALVEADPSRLSELSDVYDAVLLVEPAPQVGFILRFARTVDGEARGLRLTVSGYLLPTRVGGYVPAV